MVVWILLKILDIVCESSGVLRPQIENHCLTINKVTQSSQYWYIQYCYDNWNGMLVTSLILRANDQFTVPSEVRNQ